MQSTRTMVQASPTELDRFSLQGILDWHDTTYNSQPARAVYGRNADGAAVSFLFSSHGVLLFERCVDQEPTLNGYTTKVWTINHLLRDETSELYRLNRLIAESTSALEAALVGPKK